MYLKDKIELDEETLRKINRAARRNAEKKNGGQDKFAPKVFKQKKKYTRKEKHRGDW